MNSMDIFKIENLCSGYGDKKIIDGINFTVSSGDFISIIGPNGAGKTTLMKTLTGDLNPASGSVNFRGRSLHDTGREVLARELAVVHQFVENIQPFSVYEFVRLGRFPHQKVWEIESENDRRIVDEAIEITGIGDLRYRPLTELSGGEVQLVYIARALAQNRDVIILDEPISHLDVMHRIQIMDILHDLNRTGSTIITVLHDINISSDYCTRIIGLKEGRIFFDGRPEDVISYEKIEELFSIVCVVRDNPISGKPFVYPVPGYLRD